MSRIRSIKPAVHLDEELWDLEQSSGLPIFRGFTGLWSEADREGRFEWRPRKLKAAILPYWEGDFSRVLDALATRGFVVKYTIDGRDYGVVRTFTRHQVINNRESASILPAPPENLPRNPPNPPPEPEKKASNPRVDDACSTREVHAPVEGKGREQEGKGRESSRAHACDPPAPEHDPGETNLTALPIARRQLFERGYQQRYARKTGNICAQTSKLNEHLSTIVRWSIDAQKSDADCNAILDAFFADTDPKVVSGKHWIGFLVPKLNDYAPGALRPELKPPKSVHAADSAIEAEKMRQAAEAAFEPCPKELQKMLSRIGRKVG